MNNETSKTSTTAVASPLTAKPDLVKNIGGTTFDIHIHFSETSRETFTDKVVRLKYIPKGVFLAGRPAAGCRAGKPGPEINR